MLPQVPPCIVVLQYLTCGHVLSHFKKGVQLSYLCTPFFDSLYRWGLLKNIHFWQTHKRLSSSSPLDFWLETHTFPSFHAQPCPQMKFFLSEYVLLYFTRIRIQFKLSIVLETFPSPAPARQCTCNYFCQILILRPCSTPEGRK